MMSASSDDFTSQMDALGALIDELERACPPAALEPAREVVRALLAVQQSGLRALLAALRAASGDAGEAWLAAACADPQVSALLQMHDLAPLAPVPAQTQTQTQTQTRADKLIPASRLIARVGGVDR